MIRERPRPDCHASAPSQPVFQNMIGTSRRRVNDSGWTPQSAQPTATGFAGERFAMRCHPGSDDVAIGEEKSVTEVPDDQDADTLEQQIKVVMRTKRSRCSTLRDAVR